MPSSFSIMSRATRSSPSWPRNFEARRSMAPSSVTSTDSAAFAASDGGRSIWIRCACSAAAGRRRRSKTKRRRMMMMSFLAGHRLVRDALRARDLRAGDAQREQHLLARALAAAAFDSLVHAPTAEDRAEEKRGGDGTPAGRVRFASRFIEARHDALRESLRRRLPAPGLLP